MRGHSKNPTKNKPNRKPRNIKVMKKETNLIFFQQDLIHGRGVNGYNAICRLIENTYKTACYMSDYTQEQRRDLAFSHDKKFGFVLKSLKS
jgi:hypothetical protein